MKRNILFFTMILMLVIFMAANAYGEDTIIDKGKIVFTSKRDKNAEIYVINADGTGLTRITDSGTYDFKPIWSPDGTKILYRSRTKGGRLSWDQDYALYACNADGTGHVKLGEAYCYDPVWSPDGEKVVFVSNKDGNYEIYVAYADGNGTFRLTNNKVKDKEPSWSPDGEKILFISDNLPYIMDPDGGNLEQLIVDKGFYEKPKWSPDGKHIAFFVTGGEFGQLKGLVVMDYETREVELLDGASSAIYSIIGHDFFWSPDGSKIAMSRDLKRTSGDDTYRFHVVAFEVDTKKVIFNEGFSSNENHYYLEWSSDNVHFLFRIKRFIIIVNTQDNIGKKGKKYYIFEPAGLFRDYSDPHWSPDGSEIVYVGNKRRFTFNWSDIQIISPDGKLLRTLTDTGKDYEPDWFGN